MDSERDEKETHSSPALASGGGGDDDDDDDLQAIPTKDGSVVVDAEEETPLRPDETTTGDNNELLPEDESKSYSSPTTATTAAATSAKCEKCGKRFARRGCTQSACFACCNDTQCATHEEVRHQAQWREQVLAGTTPLQLLAKEQRSKVILPGRFKESDFSYLGETVVLYDLKQYFAHPSWREDAIRKSNKRRTRQLNHDLSSSSSNNNNGAVTTTIKKRQRQRFHDTMEELYQKSL